MATLLLLLLPLLNMHMIGAEAAAEDRDQVDASGANPGLLEDDQVLLDDDEDDEDDDDEFLDFGDEGRWLIIIK